MIFDSKIHHRRSIRLKEYDYSQNGAYFVTICTQVRACLFGEVLENHVILNNAGQMIERLYRELENKYPYIHCDAFICMPNHIHFIVMINRDMTQFVGADLCVCPHNTQGTKNNMGAHDNILGAHAGAPLHKMVQWFKTMTTNEYIRGVKLQAWHPFTTRLWQRNYYEHIIRDQNSYHKIVDYIATNPVRWVGDRYYVA